MGIRSAARVIRSLSSYSSFPRNLQVQWRERKTSTTTWVAYHRSLGATPPAFASETDWVLDCVNRAASKGPKYGGAKGNSKGGGKDNHGKGGGKGKAHGKGGR